MELAKFPNTFIKVHGMGETSPRPSVLQTRYDFDFFDSVPPLMEIGREAFGVRRMMWGSDYPPVSQREGYRNALHGVMDSPVFDSQEDREWVMGKTAVRVFNLE